MKSFNIIFKVSINDNYERYLIILTQRYDITICSNSQLKRGEGDVIEKSSFKDNRNKRI